MKEHTITCEGRMAVIKGSCVQLFKVRPQNKRKPIIESKWPKLDLGDSAAAWRAALLWTDKGFIHPDLTRSK